MPSNHNIKLDEDTRLMLQVADGDDIAYGRLYKKYFLVLVSYLTRLGRYQISPEDLAQEVFVRIWQNRKLFRADSSAKTYIFAIAKNVLHEHHRRIQHQIAVDNYSGPTSCPSKSETVLDCHEIADAIKLAKSGLSHKQRQALELVVLSSMSVTDAARLAGCSDSVFRHRLYDAKKRLLVLLKQSSGSKLLR